MISTLVLSTLLSLAAAQQTRTITIPTVGGDSNNVAASVVTAANGATTLELHCVESPCGLFPKQTLVYGPSTYNVDMSDPNTDFTATMDCDLASSTAVCRETAGGSEANFPGSSTTSYEGTDVGSATITITAGADELAQATSASSAAASQTSVQSASSSAGTASITPAPGSSSTAASANASKSGSAAASASTAGAAINALVMGGGLAGAAAGVFGGLLL
jgi:hypothetical protein